MAMLILLVLACITGVWVWADWRLTPARADETRAYAHAAVTALILGLALLSLDQEADDAWRLLGLFLAIATGMLLFLKRQRQRAFPPRLLWLHVGFAVLVIALTGWSLV